MKTRIMIPIFAAIMAVILALGTSAFKKENLKKPTKESPAFSTTYFRYIPASDFSETSLENPLNWSEVGSPSDGTNCPGITDPCIVQIEATDLTGPGTDEQKFANKLASMSTTTPYVVAGTSYTSSHQYAYGRATAKKN